MHKPLFTIVVLYHNQLELVKECINSILKSSERDFHLVVVNNGGSKDVVLPKEKRIMHIKYSDNTGYIGGHSRVFKQLKSSEASLIGKYYVLINDDTVVGSDWLDVLKRAFESDALIKIAGPVACGVGADGVGRVVNTPEFDYIEGSCLAIVSDVLEGMDLFNPLLDFAYCEDSDLCLRVRKRGYKLAKVKFEFKHYHAQTSKSILDKDIKGYHIRNTNVFKDLYKDFLKSRSFVENVWIKRRAAIGDVFLITPIIKQLKRENVYRNIYVETMCPQLLQGNPYITEINPSKDVLKYRVIDLDMAYESRPLMNIVDAYAMVAGVKLYDRIPEFFYKFTGVSEKVLKPYIIFNFEPTNWPGRNLPSSTVVEISSKIKQKGYKVVEICKSHSVVSNADYVLKNKSWSDVAELMDYADAFVGVDSSPMHLAQAGGVPGVAVFGCINPETRIVNDCIRPVVADVGCKYCHHWREAPRVHSDCLRGNPECMNKITADMVMNELGIALGKEW